MKEEAEVAAIADQLASQLWLKPKESGGYLQADKRL